MVQVRLQKSLNKRNYTFRAVKVSDTIGGYLSVQIKNRSLNKHDTGVAQLVELWSPKPGVVGSSPTTRAKFDI